MNRDEKLQEALRTSAAEFLAREANRNNLLTVTRVELSDAGKRATIFVSVFPESGEEAALKFMNRNKGEFAKFFIEHTRGARAPKVEFTIDLGEKNRRRLDELSN